MRKLLKHVFGLALLFCCIDSMSQSDLCSKKGPDATNQRIRQKVYENIRILHNKKPEAEASLQPEYTEIWTSFNALYRTMSDDLGLFTGKKKVCNDYGDELKALVDKAEAFNSKLVIASGRQNPPALGVDDVLSIIDWVIKNVTKWGSDRKANFYNALEWDEWAVVLDPSKKVITKTDVKTADSSKSSKK